MYKGLAYITGVVACATITASLLVPAKAEAADFTYQFNSTFSGTSPTGSAPWLTAELKDVAPNKVNLTLTTGGLQGTEFVDMFYLNFNPGLTVTSLAFTQLSKTGSFSDPTISTGVNAFKADGDGFYDVEFGFGTSLSSRFGVGDSFTYQITGITGLNANDFVYTSEMGGGAGTWLAAAHINSIGSGGASGWDAPLQLTPVPEPAPAILILLAAGLLFGARRLRSCTGRA